MPEVLSSDPIPVSDTRDLFDPPLFNGAELAWLAASVGQPPVVAFKEVLPPAVNVKAVRPVIERVYELMELERHEGEPWAGLGAIQTAITTYLEKAEQWRQAHRRSPRSSPRHPSMFMLDTGRRRYLGGIGSDSGRVRSYEVDGERVYFAIALNVPPEGVADFVADRPVAPTVPLDVPKAIIVDTTHGVMTCPVCKFSINFEVDAQSSRNVARMQMARHLKNAKKEPDWHRAVYAHEFS